MKDKERIKGIIEAILFTMGESVAISRLSEVLDIEEDTLKELLEEMKGDYAGKDRGICLIELDGAYQICTKIETYEYVKKLVSQPKKRSLTDVMLETLSIVAYKQPVTKQEIEAIRGVKSDFAVNKLLEYPPDKRTWQTRYNRTSNCIRNDRRIFTLLWRILY